MGFFDFVQGAFGGISGFINQVVQFLIALVGVIIKVIVFVWNTLIAVINYVLKAFKAVGEFFKHVWENGLKPLFGKFGELIKNAHQWLEDHLRPIIDWLRRAQQWLERHVWRPLRAYIQFLQRIRRYLTVLRLLHIKWAEALDRRLATTEAQLARAFLTVRGIFNQVLTWINAASDPLRLGRMVIFASIGRRSAAAMVRVLTGLPIGVFFPTLGKGSHLYEQPMVSVKDIYDPHRNPPASSILLGLSPIPMDGFSDVDPTPTDDQIDALEGLGYFADYIDMLAAGDALFDSMDTPRISILDTINERKGQLADAGMVLNTFLKNAVTV